MSRALELAKQGEGWVNPNPLVGAVVVKNGKAIGEGYHRKFGQPHAEVNALEAAGEQAQGADLYVNLEPCSHYGKRPPCADRIIDSGIKRVFIGTRDPNPLVSGKGVDKLNEAGIEVIEGVLEKEAKRLNEIYFKFITTGRPFVLLKMAMTADGKIASRTGDSKWISSDKSRRVVHELRNRYSAVLVGINTVLKDDPVLNVRLEGREVKDPLRIVLDSKGRIPLEARVLNIESDTPTIVAATEMLSKSEEKALIGRGAKVWRLGSRDGRVNLNELLERLAGEGVDSLMVEGGGTVASGFLTEELVDKVMFFVAPKIVGGREALTPVEGEGLEKVKDALQLKDISIEMVGEDLIYTGYVQSI